MKTRYGLQCIRRSHADGHHYFISSLQEKGVNDWITLAVPAESVMLFNPMTGEKGKHKPASKKAKPKYASSYIPAKVSSCKLSTMP